MKCGDTKKFIEIMEGFKVDTGYYPARSDVIRFLQPFFEIDLSIEYSHLKSNEIKKNA